MFKAIGAILIIWFLSHQFVQSFSALDEAGSAVFLTIEAVAESTQLKFK